MNASQLSCQRSSGYTEAGVGGDVSHPGGVRDGGGYTVFLSFSGSRWTQAFPAVSDVEMFPRTRKLKASLGTK